MFSPPMTLPIAVTTEASMNLPILVSQRSFQLAWKEVVSVLAGHKWKLHNLVVHIEDPSCFEDGFHQQVADFCGRHSLRNPKHVAYTIFPHRLYKGSAERLFEAYNKDRGLYQRIRTRARGGWGTYFRRMTYYETPHGIVNQLQNIIQAINERQGVWEAGYTIVIQEPGSETVRPRGGPCLNYLAVQMEHAGPHPVLGLLCVYRNQDILERGYGNYWGLCNLTCFLAKETHSAPGPVTCISSRAYIDSSRALVLDLVSRL